MKKKFRFQWGAFLLFLFFAGLFFILLTRIVTIQATGEVEGQQLAAKAAEKYSREEVLTAKRGRILDRNGEVLAEDTLTYKLVAVVSEAATQNPEKPRHVIDPEKTAEVLAAHLAVPEENILEEITSGIEKERYQVEFGAAGRELSHTEMLEIEEEELPGILFVRDLKRLYPNGTFASHLIGFAQKVEQEDGTTITKGIMGLEKTYDEILTGTNGKMEFNTDKWGYLLPGSDSTITPAIDGSDVQLTIDKTIQNFLEDAMTQAQETYSPERMMAIVADPKTGEILAMSQRPSFDPNTREGLSENWMNENVQLTIEPGSPMKIFTLAAAIEEGKWNPEATYQSGSYTLLDRTIRDHNRTGWGSITFLEGFQRSSNVSMAYLLEQIGPEQFVEYVKEFGFGKPTGIDLPNEASGKILNDWPIDRLTMTFGQGSTVTPVQMIQAGTAFVNGGVMMKPYVIDEIVNPDTKEVTLKHEPERGNQPVTALTAEKVMEVLESTVTSETGTGQSFALKDYTVAGKTGTAQVPGPNGVYLYGKENYLYSFLGYAPAEDPELMVYVAVQQPDLEPTELGSKPVSEIFKSVTENSLKYMNVQPKETGTVHITEMADYTGAYPEEVVKRLEAQGLQAVIIGDQSEVTAQYPSPGVEMIDGGMILLKTSGNPIVPDFTGWSKREILAYEQLSGLQLDISGEGFAVEQSVPAGSVIELNGRFTVQLKLPEVSHETLMPESSASAESSTSIELPQEPAEEEEPVLAEEEVTEELAPDAEAIEETPNTTE